VDSLKQVTDQAGRLGRLVDELLDVSRIESGRLEFRLAPLDLWHLAAELVNRMQTMTERHVLRLEPAPPQPVVVNADRDHLEQVLNNLIGNAIKYSPQGGPVTVSVAVTAGQDGTDRGEALLSVQDEGVGIPPGELEAIFGLFYRLESPAPRDVIPEGLGLGLYISREIIARHGGRTWATSGPGSGSTFYVALPTLVPESESGASPSRRSGRPSASGKRRARAAGG
jgi:signal transduction histidine kinase